MDLINIQHFCSVKDPVNRVKKQITDKEKLFASHITNKKLITRTYKEVSRLNNKKHINHPVCKGTKDMDKHFTEEEIQMANKHVKRWSTSLATRGMQIKSTLRYLHTPSRIAKINMALTPNAGKDSEKLDHS